MTQFEQVSKIEQQPKNGDNGLNQQAKTIDSTNIVSTNIKIRSEFEKQMERRYSATCPTNSLEQIRLELECADKAIQTDNQRHTVTGNVLAKTDIKTKKCDIIIISDF